ncbi:MAG TPA: hypothetical protein VLC08_11660, partial [Chitinolyticbacter sp.]|nr:hypothetical protein [Chitinolyticbacter sp.]
MCNLLSGFEIFSARDRWNTEREREKNGAVHGAGQLQFPGLGHPVFAALQQWRHSKAGQRLTSPPYAYAASAYWLQVPACCFAGGRLRKPAGIT